MPHCAVAEHFHPSAHHCPSQCAWFSQDSTGMLIVPKQRILLDAGCEGPIPRRMDLDSSGLGLHRVAVA